ncbi:MAG: hypothetical protein MJE66_22140 [Proteobacteria bacterium]|nr:hypothetical protein [Pseudomonadota bacterium]
MADSAAFDFVCAQLEQGTALDRLEARGTVRLALKQAGLEARTVTPDQMAVVVEKILPAELSARGIDSGDSVCGTIKSGLATVDAGDVGETPDAVFERLGG